MKKFYLLLFVCLLFTLVGCQQKETDVEPETNDVKENVAEETEEEKVSLLTNEEAREVVAQNLTDIENVFDTHFDADKMLYMVDEGIFYPERYPEDVYELVTFMQEKLQPYLAKSNMEKMTQTFLLDYANSLQLRSYVNAEDIHTRFQVIDQTEDFFEASFVTLEDEASAMMGRTYIVRYRKDGEHWGLQDVSYEDTSEKPLHITVDDLKEYYQRLGFTFEFTEEVETAYGTFIVYKVNDIFEARNIEDSSHDHDLVYQLNEPGEQIIEETAEIKEDIPSDITTATKEQVIRSYVGKWTSDFALEKPYYIFELNVDGDKVGIDFYLETEATDSAFHIKGNMSGAAFAEQNYDKVLFVDQITGEEGYITVELRENGFSVYVEKDTTADDGFMEYYFMDRIE